MFVPFFSFFCAICLVFVVQSGYLAGIDAFIFQIIKFSLPVVTYNKDINMILVHISLFLLPVIFRYNEVNVSDCFN